MKAKDLLKTLKFMISRKMNLFITGQPGVGKSEIVEQAVSEMNYDLMICHPVIEDPTDKKGLPFADKENGAANFLPFGDLKRMMDAKKELVVFIDDFGQACPAVQASYMQLLLAREVAGKKISDKVIFVSATNRKSDMAGVSGILEPVKSRFATIVELTPDADAWVDWAVKNGMPMELIAFIKMRPQFISAWKPSRDMTNAPTPRTIANLGKMMNQGLPKEIEYEVFCGAVGREMATEFVGFLKIFRSLPNINLILSNPNEADVPSASNVLYALVGALANKADKKTFSNIMLYVNRIPAEFQVLFVMTATKKTAELKETADYINWISKNQDLLLV